MFMQNTVLENMKIIKFAVGNVDILLLYVICGDKMKSPNRK